MNYLPILFLLLCTNFLHPQQPGNENCPNIRIDGPTALLVPNQRIELRANISNLASTDKVSYQWNISSGTIMAGQGTSRLVMRASDKLGAKLEIHLKVEGIPDNCPGSADFIMLMAERIHDFSLFDIYGAINWREERKRLDNFAIQLKNERQAKGYIVVYNKGRKFIRHGSQVRRYLTDRHGIKAGRLVVLDGGRKGNFEIRLYVIPAGAFPPAL